MDVAAIYHDASAHRARCVPRLSGEDGQGRGQCLLVLFLSGSSQSGKTVFRYEAWSDVRTGLLAISGEPPSRKTSTTYSMADRRASYLDDLLIPQRKAVVRLHGGQQPHLESDGRASDEEALTGPVMMTDRGNREDDVERSHDDCLHTSIYIFCYFVLVLFYLIHLL